MHVRQFTRTDFKPLLTFVAENAKSRWPHQTYLMTSDVAWQFPGCNPKDNIRLWFDDRGLAGYVWFQPPDTVLFDTRVDLPDAPSLWVAMLEWGSLRRELFDAGYPFYIDLESMKQWRDAPREPVVHPLADRRFNVTSAFESDAERTELLLSQGFEATGHFEPYLAIDLLGFEPPILAKGMRVRSVAESELEQRAALHRAAWAPGSSFDLAQYQKIRAVSEVFDPALDIVAVVGDEFASYTIAWQDPVSKIGSFEPFGTAPEFRGTGASQAVLNTGLKLLADRDMHSARLYTAGFNHQAQRLYEGCGFKQVDTRRTFIRQSS